MIQHRSHLCPSKSLPVTNEAGSGPRMLSNGPGVNSLRITRIDRYRTDANRTYGTTEGILAWEPLEGDYSCRQDVSVACVAMQRRAAASALCASLE